MSEASPEQKDAATATAAGATDLTGQQSVVIGRSTGADIELQNPTVSLRHAEVAQATDGALVVTDLGSSNGTFVDGQRLVPGRPATLGASSALVIGHTRFTVDNGRLAQQDESKKLRLDALHLVTLTPKGRQLLRDISIPIEPAEFVAIVGASGAGKSTLLGALSGLRPATSGRVLVNGTDLYSNFDAYQTHLGYVPQDDIIHRDLTVRASLEYAAQLRLPRDTSREEREQRITHVLQTLELTERADVLVSSLSGGQRKRVSIGVELLTSPGLFFLDEATSGLDPATEAHMMRTLRGLADAGHTVMLVTHATKNAVLCDRIAFMAEGGYLAYFGPPDRAPSYFGVDDFDGIYERVSGELSPAEWAAKYAASPEYKSYVTSQIVDDAEVHPEETFAEVRRRPRFGDSLRQFGVLSRRYLTLIARDRANLLLLLAIAPALACIDFLAWHKDVLEPTRGDLRSSLTMLFLSSLIPFLVGALTSVREIVKEAPIYERERAVGLGLGPYIFSKVGVAALFCLYHTTAFVAIKFVAVDFSALPTANLVQYYFIVYLAVFSGAMSGLVISAFVPREDRAMHIVAAVVVVQLVFSGGLVALSDLGPPGTALGAITSVNWALKGAAAAAQIDTGPCQGAGIETCSLPGMRSLAPNERVLVISSLDRDFADVPGANIYVCFAGLLMINAVLLFGLLALQKRKDRHIGSH